MASCAEGFPEVELGFVEPCPKWKLVSRYFPSKVGGRPSWLNLKELPSIKDLECPLCESPCIFLLQIYAPISNLNCCFHRALFVFVCKNEKCLPSRKENFKVFRCQLPRQNDCYDFEPPDEDESLLKPSAEDFLQLCRICGCRGPLKCAKCKIATYCSEVHQKIDWKEAHKKICKENKVSTEVVPEENNKLLFPEFELITEVEPAKETKATKSEEELMKEFQHFINNSQSKTNESLNEDELEAGSLKEDKSFQKFIQRIQRDPEQVLRYQIGGDPVWVSEEKILKIEDVPPCLCGSQRQFEFQIMPQLLNHLQVDSTEESLDWGTLAIYSCKNNCNDGSPYHSEFIWKQDFVNQSS